MRERSGDVKNTASKRRRGPAALGRVRGASTDEGGTPGHVKAEAKGVAKTEGVCCAR